MAKILSVGSISDFLNDKKETNKFERFLIENETTIKTSLIVLSSAVIFQSFTPDFVLAADNMGIDAKGREIYAKLIEIGKWFIIGKGAIDIIKNVTSGDFDSAKKNGLGYVLIYVILLGLPWAFDQVEMAFRDL